MYPAQDSLSQMLYDVIDSSSWKSFTILYESPIWLARVSSLLEYFDDPRENNFTIRQLNGGDEDNKNYRPMLELVKESEQPNIILECSTENLLDILDQVKICSSKFKIVCIIFRIIKQFLYFSIDVTSEFIVEVTTLDHHQF